MDCNKTTNFLAELQRLCDSRDRCIANAADKEQCPMFGFCEEALTKICVEDAIKLVEAIQKWSNEHPKKTYAQDFLEKFPKAQSNSDGIPYVCRQATYGGECPGSECEKYDYTGACYRCWNEPMNDE